MDAWWPRWVEAQFKPALGARRFDTLTKTVAIDNPPNSHGDHLGSAYQGSWYGYVSKDLRTVLGDKVRGHVLARVLRGARSAAARRCGARWRPR